MGAAASSPFVATSRFFIQVADDPSAAAAETIDICLACEKDSYSPELRDMSEKKEYFRQFMRGVLSTDKYTVFRWSTWDTSNADIVIPTEDLIRQRRANVSARYRMPSRRVFDAIFTMHCPFACISDKSFRTACALLKPLGLVVVVSAGTSDQTHEAFRIRPTPFGDCSEDADTLHGGVNRLRQVHRTTGGGMHMVVWQKSYVY